MADEMIGSVLHITPKEFEPNPVPDSDSVREVQEAMIKHMADLWRIPPSVYLTLTLPPERLRFVRAMAKLDRK